MLTNVQTTNDGKIVIQYWLFYVFNYNPGFVIGAHHEGDWEMVQVVLSSETASTPDRVDYSQHYGGESLSWDEISKEIWHPIVKVVWDDGHPSYPVPNSQQSTYETDLAGNGYNIKLPPQEYKVTVIYYQEWLKFKGYWGASWGNSIGPSVSGPVLRMGAGASMWIDPMYWGDQI